MKLADIASFVFGRASGAYLPERVRQSIAQQEIGSEILIGWFQLALVASFGTLYAIAPKTSTSMFQPVPWALALYALFTLARLGFAYRRWLPPALLMVSVVMDMGLLMTLIWSFHIQYEQPPSFYLKAPTMLYVFIFIALRALRFNPLYIVMAGATAAAGWLFLMLYVISVNPADPMITRNYVVYLTSNSVLIGAEVDKILSIALVTLVLAVAVLRGQRLLRQAVADSVAAKDLSRFVSREIADRITSADAAIQPGDGESKVATVLFTDIEGFSTVAEKLSPQELVRTINEYFGAVSEVIDRFGGVITQFQGDAMLIAFNTVTPDPDHAANAVRTALGIQDATAARRFGNGIALKTRCGINTGALTAGAVGARDRLVFTVHGDEVNVAARLEQLNKQYKTYVLVSEQTKAAAGDGWNFKPIGEVTVRGRSQPTAVYTVG